MQNRVKRITIVTTPEVAKTLRFIAAANRKTVSTFLNDIICQQLDEKLLEVRDLLKSLEDGM